MDLSEPVEIIHEYLTEALCQEVFRDVRKSERQRKWSLFALARFWIAVVLTAPASLTQLLEQVGRCVRGVPALGLLPAVEASAEAFFQRSKNLPSSFFEALYSHFVERIRTIAPRSYVANLSHLLNHFADIFVIDGSRLDAVARRLKIVWNERSVILPGCITAVYDVFRGFADRIWFYGDAAMSEFQRAFAAIESLTPGSLLIGDRLYSSLEIFDALEAHGCSGIFRKAKNLKVKTIQRLGRVSGPRGILQDELVQAGPRGRVLRLITLKKGRRSYSALTDVLDPAILSPTEAMELYLVRWRVERLFFDLKDVLDLHRLYAANPNATAMQLFATAILHVAFRIAQAHIAERKEVAPEEISSAKLYPRLAIASIALIEAEYVFDRTCRANRGTKLRKPSWRGLPKIQTTLSAILVEHRKGRRRKRRYCRSRARWKSFKHVPGGSRLT